MHDEIIHRFGDVCEESALPFRQTVPHCTKNNQLLPNYQSLFRNIPNSSANHLILQAHKINMMPNLTNTTKRLLVEQDTLHSPSPTDPPNRQLRHNITDSEV